MGFRDNSRFGALNFCQFGGGMGHGTTAVKVKLYYIIMVRGKLGRYVEWEYQDRFGIVLVA